MEATKENPISSLDSMTRITVQEHSDTCPKHGCEREGFELNGRSIKFCRLCDEEARKLELQEKRVESRMSQGVIDRKLEKAMLGPRFRGKTFENYTIENEKQKKAVEICRNFIADFERSMGLIFLGKTGTGKNHLAAAIANEMARTTNKTILFTEALKFVRAIKESWGKGEGPRESEVMKYFREPDLLVIDEIGVQFESPTERIYLTEIINDRYNWEVPTILSGNVDMKELTAIIGERALDRFREGGKVVVFDWPGWRGRR